MRHDPFLRARAADPDAVVKSRPVTPKTAKPPGPRVVEVDGDQDSLARTGESADPTDSFRPGGVTDTPVEGGDLVKPVGKDEEVFKVWSDEARAAAAEARRGGKTGLGSKKPSYDRPHRGTGIRPAVPLSPRVGPRFGLKKPAGGRFDPKDPRRRQWA